MTTLKQKNALVQMKEDLIEYAMRVNRLRAIPSIDDGLKTIHRRIIYGAMAYEKAYGNTKRKSSAIVGAVMGSLHPHGDTSIYGAMKPLANWFEIKMPLLEPDGNWGNMKGKSAAAARYTECRVSPFAVDAVYGELAVTNKVVDWSPNYDSSKMEPESLPVKVPLLLINGTFGIGFGTKVNVPAHRFADVIDATVNLIDNPDAEVVLIPDSCTVTELIDTDWKAICNNGQGTYKMRGIIEEGEFVNKKKVDQALILRSMPDLTFANTITEKIEELVDKKVLPQVIGMHDDSTDEQLCIYIILKPGSDPNYVKDVIYKNTKMEDVVSVNLQVIYKNNPIRLSYKAYLEHFIAKRAEAKLRVYCNELADLQTETHRLETYIKASKSAEMDEIIKLVRKQKTTDRAEVRELIISKLGVTDIQANFILQTDIMKLTKGYIAHYEARYAEVEAMIQSYTRIIVDPSLILQDIKKELLELKAVYGKQPRLTRIISKSSANNIPQGIFNVIVTQNNFVKKVGENDGYGKFSGDAPKFIQRADNEDNLILFDEIGRVCKIPVHKIPLSDPKTNGLDLRLLNKKIISPIIKSCSENEIKATINASVMSKCNVVVLTAQGNIKKMDLDDFDNIPRSGILYTKLTDGDIVKAIEILDENSEIIIYSHNKALRLPLSEIPHLKRNTKGSKAMNENLVDGMTAICRADITDLVVFTDKGKINRFSISALEPSKRARAGSRVIKLGKGDFIKSIHAVSKDNVIKVDIMNTRAGDDSQQSLLLNVGDIEPGSSIAPGKSLVSKSQVLISTEVVS